MKGRVAIVREQGQDFAVLSVKASAIRDPAAREDLLRFCTAEFGVRSALLGDDGRTWGPTDIVNWLSGVAVQRLPWREFWTAN
jgi:hypothetical protein